MGERWVSQYLTATMTRRCPSLHHEGVEVFIEIHPKDARRLNLKKEMR
jgi:anaerobic selenocysteine-containing dehydrogenase